jgi:hypothetical protein
VYALALSRCGRWPQLAPEAIDLYEVNLLANRISRHPVTATLLEETEDWVYRSLLELAALTDGLPFEELDLSDFEVAERPVTCQWCNFRPLCLRLLEQAARPQAPIAIQGSLW